MEMYNEMNVVVMTANTTSIMQSMGGVMIPLMDLSQVNWKSSGKDSQL